MQKSRELGLRMSETRSHIMLKLNLILVLHKPLAGVFP